jgi:glutaminase
MLREQSTTELPVRNGHRPGSRTPFPLPIPMIDALLDELHARYKDVDEGAVATYIPELGKADPNLFGLAVASVDGKVFEAGDARTEFTIQSISKPFVYAMALTEHGRDSVYRRVGVEPSGDAFNSIVLDQKTNRPFNAMVNAGAIATAALIPGATLAERSEAQLALFSAAAGRRLTIDASVYRSERDTGHRNRAIAWLMLNFGMIEGVVDDILDLYFQQCSILVNARDLAIMGATMANVGINPVTGENVFDMECIQDVLSVMFTCGMYDYSGEWAFRVGMPAKSGVAGGILAVVNRQLGIGTYSPRLDARGNSVRGIAVCKDLSEELGLHAFNFMNHGSNFLKSMLDDPTPA